MKKLINLFVKVLKIAGITILIGVILYAGFIIYQKQNTSVVVENLTPSQSEYQERVEQKMEETTEEWIEKHRVWAEQEVSKEIIAEQELKLESLREKELSL